jgi:hypothetical protein
MAVLPPKKGSSSRRPSLRGVIQQDITRGVERSRAWPPKRGKNVHPKTKAQMDVFRQAQWAWKFMDARIQADITAAVHGSPIMPRDVWLMMISGRLWWFLNADGKKEFSMAVIKDVSASLDVFSQTEGMMLRRGAELWEALDPSDPAWITELLDLFGPADGQALRKIPGGWEPFDPTPPPAAGPVVTQAYKLNATPGTALGWNNVDMNTIQADPEGWYDTSNGRFTPDRAGWYQLQLEVMLNATRCQAPGFQTNGIADWLAGNNFPTGMQGGNAVLTTYFNGTTDYVRCRVYATGIAQYQVGLGSTYFTAIGPF